MHLLGTRERIELLTLFKKAPLLGMFWSGRYTIDRRDEKTLRYALLVVLARTVNLNAAEMACSLQAVGAFISELPDSPLSGRRVNGHWFEITCLPSAKLVSSYNTPQAPRMPVTAVVV